MSQAINQMRVTLLGFCLLLGACGNLPPAPTDHFYRLQPVNLPPVAHKLPAAFAVQTFRADSLYAERPIIFTEQASLRQLRQYHYHLWLYPPAQMVQEHLVASLGNTIAWRGGSQVPDVLQGRILKFERVLSGSSSKAVVAIELRLERAADNLLTRTYEAEQPASDESIGTFVVAMEQALGKIYAQFQADIAQIR